MLGPHPFLIVCGSMSFRLDSDALVVVVRSPRVRVGRCRLLGVVIFLKFVRRATAWRCFPLADPTGPGQVDRVNSPVLLGEEGGATALTIAWFTARLVRRQHALFGM